MRSWVPFLFFSKKEKVQLVAALREAETKTSGEMRVHLVRCFKKNPEEEAKRLFERLRMTATAERNGVLIVLGIRDRRFVILGDEGIHAKVGPGFWDEVARAMESAFREDRFADGLTAGIHLAGEKLRLHFPRKNDDTNELPDTLSYSI